MSDSDLAFFTTLARFGSFTRAGLELGISASAVSRRLVRLEDRLGVRLLNRTTRRVTLTGEGEVYLSTATRLLSEIEALEQSMARSRDYPHGLLRVNATFGFGREYVAPAISAFMRRYPDVEAKLTLTDAPLNPVEAGIDLNIRFGMPTAERLVIRRLQPNRRFLIAAPTYLERAGTPQRLEELKHHACIILRQEYHAYDVWRFDDLGMGSVPSIKVSGPLSTNDGEVARNWVLDGQGIMLRSEWDTAADIRAGKLCVVLSRYRQTAQILAVYPERHNLSAKVHRFIEFFSDRLAAANATTPLTHSSKILRG